MFSGSPETPNKQLADSNGAVFNGYVKVVLNWSNATLAINFLLEVTFLRLYILTSIQRQVYYQNKKKAHRRTSRSLKPGSQT